MTLLIASVIADDAATLIARAEAAWAAGAEAVELRMDGLANGVDEIRDYVARRPQRQFIVLGVLLVATNEPNSEPCSSGGDSFFYQFDYQSGSYVASAPGAVVGVRSGSALMAGFVVYRLPSGQLKYTGIDVSGKKQTGGVNPGSGGAVGKRVSWRELVL